MTTEQIQFLVRNQINRLEMATAGPNLEVFESEGYAAIEHREQKGWYDVVDARGDRLHMDVGGANILLFRVNSRANAISAVLRLAQAYRNRTQEVQP